eukprot:8923800-Pyramimonas_sp.AAC.1
MEVCDGCGKAQQRQTVNSSRRRPPVRTRNSICNASASSFAHPDGGAPSCAKKLSVENAHAEYAT